MAHGKETPRQKMIGMMYLVLTAMLALNVQKEVLKAFVRIDESLVKTVKNYTQKNKMIYDDFAAKYLANQQKVEKWKKLADETHVKADALFDLVQSMKMDIIHRAEGEETEAIAGNEIILDNVKRPDNMDSPAVVMYGDNNNGRGKELKAELIKFKEWLLQNIDQDATATREGIAKSLDTSDPPPKGAATPSWEAENFEMLPLAGVIAIMSGMQANIRNAESDMIRYLYSQIDAKDYKVNKLEATVIPNSKYVFKNNEYRAKIFLAASDSTQKPMIYIGKVDSTEGKYRMARIDDSIQAGSDGKALYSRRVGSVGSFNYEGLLALTNPDGNKTYEFFKEEYNVIEGIYGVNPTKMNVIFIGVDNPLEVYVSGVAGEKIYASATNGSLARQRDGTWIARPKSVGNCLIQVLAEIDGKKQEMGWEEFRVMLVPSPVAKVGGKNGGVMNKEVLLAQKAIIADLENFYFDLEFKIVEFTVSSTVRGFTKEIEKKGVGGTLDNEVKDFIRNLTKGQTVYFQNVKAVGPDGDVRRLNTIDIKLN